MAHLLPEIPGCPANRVLHAVVLGDVAPAAAAALRAEQLLHPFVGEHQHLVGLDQQLGPAAVHAALLQLFRGEQM